MALLLPCTFVFNSLPRFFWESFWVLLVVKPLKDILWALLWALKAFMVEFHGFCIYISRRRHPYIESLLTLWYHTTSNNTRRVVLTESGEPKLSAHHTSIIAWPSIVDNSPPCLIEANLHTTLPHTHCAAISCNQSHITIVTENCKKIICAFSAALAKRLLEQSILH